MNTQVSASLAREEMAARSLKNQLQQCYSQITVPDTVATLRENCANDQSTFANELKKLREFMIQHIGSRTSEMKPLKAVEVMKETGDKHSSFYNRLDKNHPAYDPSFPEPFPFGPSKSRRWWKHEIHRWLQEQDTRERGGE